MLKKSCILLLSISLLELCLTSCGRQQYCMGRFVSCVIYAGSDLPYPRFNLENYSTVHFDSLTIQNDILIENYDCQTAKNFSFIKSAYAYKPSPPVVTIQDRIDSIKFFTVRNYNGTHIAGSSMDDIMKHKIDNANNWTGPGISTSKISSDLNTQFEKQSQYRNFGYYSRFTEKPAFNNDTVQIAIKMFLRNGKVFEAQSQPFLLKY